MEIDWDLVKKNTLWNYENLIAKILVVLDYGFVQEYYDHNMIEAGIYSENIRQCYLQNTKETEFIDEIDKRQWSDEQIRRHESTPGRQSRQQPRHFSHAWHQIRRQIRKAHEGRPESRLPQVAPQLQT